MNWKGFFKPTAGKLMVFFIFLTLFFSIFTVASVIHAGFLGTSLGVLSVNYHNLWQQVTTNSTLNITSINDTYYKSLNAIKSAELNSFNFISNYITSINTIISLPLYIPNYLPLYAPSIVIIILDLIYWYLLSCLILWIYNKVKKK